LYLADREHAYYLNLEVDEGPERLRERLAHLVDVAPVHNSLAGLVAALATAAPCEIAIDGLDRAAPETLQELGELAASAPLGVSLLYASRSRTTIDFRRFLVNGYGTMLDGSQLGFNADELVLLADLHGVRCEPWEAERLLEETDGWPIVASWVVREAAESGTGLSGAYDRWHRRNGHLFQEFLADQLRATDATTRAALREVLGGALDDRDRLASLEAQGLFVYFDGEGYRPYRAARQSEAVADRDADAPPEPSPLLVARLFGRFEVEIGGRRIEWIRRRDAQLFRYLLLKPSGRATRAELRDVFWPGGDYHSAQSLRTATSNIRKALAKVAGYDGVVRYFSSRGDIAIDLKRAVVDVRRFAEHVADGDVECERGCFREALAHYRAAESLYAGDLLAGEFPEPWHVGRAEMYKAMFAGVLERLAKHHADAGRFRHARDYAERAGKLRAGAGFEAHAGA
jgi:hypothetical protein